MKLNKNRTGRILTVRVRIRLILPVRYPANQYRYPRSGKQKDVQNKQTKRMNREKKPSHFPELYTVQVIRVLPFVMIYTVHVRSIHTVGIFTNGTGT